MLRFILGTSLFFSLLSFSLAAPAQAEPDSSPTQKLIKAATAQVGVTTSYDPAYRTLSYPGGDVPLSTGVCTDVVVRALRATGVDLQVLVHKDMTQHFRSYPQLWGLSGPDKNIDHRRVPNLMRFFKRRGLSITPQTTPLSYQPGDIVAWRLPNGRLHLGIVSDKLNATGTHHLMVHNLSVGAKLEDVLFEFEIIGQYRYYPEG